MKLLVTTGGYAILSCRCGIECESGSSMVRGGGNVDDDDDDDDDDAILLLVLELFPSRDPVDIDRGMAVPDIVALLLLLLKSVGIDRGADMSVVVVVVVVDDDLVGDGNIGHQLLLAILVQDRLVDLPMLSLSLLSRSLPLLLLLMMMLWLVVLLLPRGR
jgi:hypothetical protein